MSKALPSLFSSPVGRGAGTKPLGAAVVALGAALAASPAGADQAYPPGLFENSPVVPPGQPTGEPAPGQASGPNGPAADAGPQGYETPPAPGYDAPPAPGYGGPPGPYCPVAGRPDVYASPSDYCAGIATRVFGSLEELRRAHARCDRAYNAPPPPPGYPPAY